MRAIIVSICRRGSGGAEGEHHRQTLCGWTGIRTGSLVPVLELNLWDLLPPRVKSEENKGQHRLGGFLEKAGFELGPEIQVDRCELLGEEAGRDFQVGEQCGQGRASGRVSGGAVRRHAHLEASVFQWKEKGLQGQTHFSSSSSSVTYSLDQLPRASVSSSVHWKEINTLITGLLVRDTIHVVSSAETVAL